MVDNKGAVRARAMTAATILAVACAGLVFQVLATARDRARLSPPGRLVDVGGHKLHLLVTGDERGGPTAVLEAGGMATSPQWALIQPGIADFAKVVSYDRAGLGWSEQGPRPRDARTIARELHAALLNAGLPGPYLLVGASLGGPYATVFADTYRDETHGLVLVDSVHPDQLQRLPAQAQRALSALRIANRALPMLARLGLTHLVDVTVLRATYAGTVLEGVATRPIGYELTAESHVISLDASQPAQLAGLIWQAISTPLGAPYVPLHAAMTDVPASYARGENTYSAGSAYWAFHGAHALRTLIDKTAPTSTPQWWIDLEQASLDEAPLVARMLADAYRVDPAAAVDLARRASTGGAAQAVSQALRATSDMMTATAAAAAAKHLEATASPG